MENEKKVMSTLVKAQTEESNGQVEGFCGSNYSSGAVSCGKSYSSGGVSGTSEELDILV